MDLCFFAFFWDVKCLKNRTLTLQENPEVIHFWSRQPTQTQSAQMKVTETTKVLLIKVNNNNTGLTYNHIQKNLRCLVKGDVLQVPIDLKRLIQ
ncbi:hypothetical protein Lpp221_13654 [Lacticaseibacillus paracasei subsp. paracasei Lpp221]|nr:hypothetical protein Lpp219_14711 [Lacticaseibacillus paracasei subsp. paracasei Lpp219]EPC77574.1 hypothetical protein Lpp221_13654 [Lacticaseibacillus paracasei subsp. paracasei Lpp221]EPD01007.1 hypothetical protein Lpp227_00325 [Lacticaseibacillus paracasei subsp. paracasei Lpp227]OFS05052.1 hypothetical protein HMPREF3095_09880 [Lactobacillus sp. HMSC25A02]